ncbi:MAG TPA: DUF308 domain-containing protein [Anaerolineales bacterium]|nr:DUF308 domain-containing protein [Anaerolineales bacterium]
MTTAAMAPQTEDKSMWWIPLIGGIAAIILGLLLLSAPAMTTATLVVFLGIYWLVGGIVSIVTIFTREDKKGWGWSLFLGVLGIIAGILVLQHPLWSTILVPAVLVIVLAVDGLIIGVIQLIQGFTGGGAGPIILGILSIIFGVILLANPMLATLGLPLVLGIFAVIGGIVAIVQAFRMK